MPETDTERVTSYLVRAELPPVFPLEGLYPVHGAMAARGFAALPAFMPVTAGSSVSARGTSTGTASTFIIGADGADPGGDAAAGESYVVFGSPQGFPAASAASLYPAGGGDGSRGFVPLARSR
jgi:hypothetical protein